MKARWEPGDPGRPCEVHDCWEVADYYYTLSTAIYSTCSEHRIPESEWDDWTEYTPDEYKKLMFVRTVLDA